jgi:hypothetical protein
LGDATGDALSPDCVPCGKPTSGGGAR